MSDQTTALKDKSKLTIRLSWSLLCAILVLSNIITIVLWKPWGTTAASTRKISVNGEVTLKEVPDEYVLYPYFEFTNSDRAKATQELTTQSVAITAKLTELGVKSEQIKSSTNNYDRYTGYPATTDETQDTMQLQYTITVNDKDMAQKVQDYLLTLGPKGQISPQAQFSEAKRKELESTAREKAIVDAKTKADKTAAQFGAKVGKVITISDGTGYGVSPLSAGMDLAVSEAKSTSASVPVQSGQNDFVFSVSVEYELK